MTDNEKRLNKIISILTTELETERERVIERDYVILKMEAQLKQSSTAH
jgi:hypothetical protein